MNYVKDDIIEATVSGIEPYGIFVTFDGEYNGLIHISEIDNSFINDLNDYVSIGEKIFVHILEIDEKNKHLNLSIKNINYKGKNGIINESISGFLPLSKKMPEWTINSINNINKKNE